MKRSNWIVALAVLLLSVGSLSANNIKIEWTGTVKDGMDRANIFGLGTNGDLTGKDFKAEFIVDPTLGFVQSYANYFATEGGTGVFGQPASPILSAILTINGESYSFLSDTYGGYIRDGRANRSGIFSEADHQQSAAKDILFLEVFLFDNSIPFSDINENLDIPLSLGARGVFQASTPNDVYLFSGNLTPLHVRIGSADVVEPPGVPEPSTTLLTVAGIGLLFGYRRLRRTA